METFIENYIDVFYLLLILFVGKILTLDDIIEPLPFKVKGVLLRIGVAWRILIFSSVVGILMYCLNYTDDWQKLVVTWSMANSMYALLFKDVFYFIESSVRAYLNKT